MNTILGYHRPSLTITCLIWFLLGPTSLPVLPQGGKRTIDFEKISTTGRGNSAATAVSTQYADQGVRFENAPVVDYASSEARDFPHSGRKAIELCSGIEICDTSAFEMSFATPQSRVKVWAGYFGSADKPFKVVLETFDRKGVAVQSVDALLDATHGPALIRTPLEVQVSESRIVRAVVRIPDKQVRPMGLALDDVEFEASVPKPDLHIQHLTHRIEGDTHLLEAIVENVGHSASPAAMIQGKAEGVLASANVPPLAVKAMATVSMKLATPLAAGKYAFHVVIDPLHQLQEERTDNNSADLVVEVPAAILPVPQATVPNVLGLSLPNARAAIERAQLSTTLVAAAVDEAAAVVEGQTPVSGSLVPVRSSVALTLQAPPQNSFPWWLVVSGATIAAAIAGYTVHKRGASSPAHARISTIQTMDVGDQHIELDPSQSKIKDIAFRFEPGMSAQEIQEETRA